MLTWIYLLLPSKCSVKDQRRIVGGIGGGVLQSNNMVLRVVTGCGNQQGKDYVFLVLAGTVIGTQNFSGICDSERVPLYYPAESYSQSFYQ